MYEKDLVQVNEIIKRMEPKYIEKISDDFLNIIENNMDKTYEFKYDDSKGLLEQDLTSNAKAIISFMYISFLASEAEKKEYKKLLLEDKKNYEQQFSYDNLFQTKDKLKNTSPKIDSNCELIVPKKWYQKIFERIKSFFNFK